MFYFILFIIAMPFVIFLSYVLLLLLTRSTGWSAHMGKIREITTVGVTPANKPVEYTILIVTREIGESLLRKLESISRLERKESISNVLIGLDGASVSGLQDSFRLRLDKVESELSIQYVETSTHIGKNAVINKMLPLAEGSILLFTDVDAAIASDSLASLNLWFNDPGVGAVVGLRVIADKSKFGSAQGSYVDFDTYIKNLEMRFLGSVTSCDGKLYAIRSELANSIPLHVTDDTFIGLGAPLKGRRLVFDAKITADIGRPAKNPPHEFDRRRRVTTRGLHSLVERRQLFGFVHYGWYSYCLFANKVCRRFAPMSLALVLLISLFALGSVIGLLSVLAVLLLLLTSFRYLNREAHVGLEVNTSSNDGNFYSQSNGVVTDAITPETHKTQSKPVRLFSAGAYFLLGMSAMTLGTVDFLLGKKVCKWEPRKSV